MVLCSHGERFSAPVYYRANTERQTFMLTCTPTPNLKSPVNMHVFGVWEEAQVLEGTHTDRPQQAKEFNPIFQLVNRNTTDNYYIIVFYLFM